MSRLQEKEILKTFGRQVAEVRKSRGLTQQELAEAVSMSVVAIAYIETGKRWVRPLTLHKIAKSLKVPASEFFKGF